MKTSPRIFAFSVPSWISLIGFVSACVAAFALVTGCQSSDSKPGEKESKDDRAKVGDEVSLKADRSQFDELRKDVPEEIKRSNDELAFIRELMKEGNEEPGKIRERFSQAARARRDKFDKDSHRRRDDFNRREKKMREDFLKRIKTDREKYLADNKKPKPDERRDFFNELEAQRADFFADQKEHRTDFESGETEARKTFEAYMTERRNQFEQEAREYSTTYYDRRKNVDLKKRMEEKAKAKAKREADEVERKDRGGGDAGGGRGHGGATSDGNGEPAVDKDLEDFKAIPKSPSTPLTSPDGK